MNENVAIIGAGLTGEAPGACVDTYKDFSI